MLVEELFGDIFEKIFGNPFGNNPSKGSSKGPDLGKKVESVVKRLIPVMQREEKKPHVYKSDNLKGVDKQLDKKGYVEVKPMSKRFTDDDVNDKNKKLSLNEYDGKNTVEIDSTAIAEPIKYDEKTGEVWLRFKGKDGKPTGKWYHYVSMDKNQFESFMKSSSKGRYVTKQMKYKNHDPAYGPAPIRNA